eukprot:TRINITY_DN1028_c0_g1_i2.p1 TRINITY_DN1028_c0_g1~~TRINITY_DN1028_c0_g1_i2.p1  ORF type:complete len:217 (+),score=0.89 TRINITY_DN1028_c0_g1_i2:89-739(+)
MMPKNKGKGGKTRRRPGKPKRNRPPERALRIPEDGQEFGMVCRPMMKRKVIFRLESGEECTGDLVGCGKRPRPFLVPNDIVLIEHWRRPPYLLPRVLIHQRYTPSQVDELRAMGYLTREVPFHPDNMKVYAPATRKAVHTAVMIHSHCIHTMLYWLPRELFMLVLYSLSVPMATLCESWDDINDDHSCTEDDDSVYERVRLVELAAEEVEAEIEGL